MEDMPVKISHKMKKNLIIAVVIIIGITILFIERNETTIMKKNVEDYIEISYTLTPEEVLLNYFKFINEHNYDLLLLTLAQNQRNVVFNDQNVKYINIIFMEDITNDEEKLESGGRLNSAFDYITKGRHKE